MKTTYYLRSLGTSKIESSTDLSAEATAKEEAETKACSIDAMMNGGECEACQ